jgi:hypothetical protein
MKECVGCGYCCIKCPCVFGQILHHFINYKERCPYLEWTGEKYHCRAMTSMKNKKDATQNEWVIYLMREQMLGNGCENPRNHFRKDVRER